MKQAREKSLRRKLARTMIAITFISIAVLSVMTTVLMIRMGDLFARSTLEAGETAELTISS